MPAEIQPPELARLVDFAERPRVENWSFRAALTRYAQAEPQRASNIIEVMRRADVALSKEAKALERDGRAIWEQTSGDGDPSSSLVELLRALRQLDDLGDMVAEWAVDRGTQRPDGEIDEVATALTSLLDRIGVPREERPRPTGRRG